MDLATELGGIALTAPKPAASCGMQLVLTTHNIVVRLLPAKRVWHKSLSQLIRCGVVVEFELQPAMKRAPNPSSVIRDNTV
jgi:hypothetical protein